MNTAVFALKPVGFLSPSLQIILICLLFIATIFSQYREHKKTGKTLAGRFPTVTFFFFCPIYEEIIFRGFILFGLMNIYSTVTAIVISSFIFGLWHLKNIFVLSKKELILQMLYTGIVFGPITAFVTVFSGTIWLAVIIHFCNNLFTSHTLDRLGSN